MTIEYLICLILAIGLLITYCIIMKNKEFWLTMLYICVVIVNLGYFLLSIAKTVEFAIFSNDIAYFGSVFLSMCMFLTIVRLCGFEIKKAHIITCVSLGVLMFAIIASSPMLPLYYKSVDIQTIGGATKLVKEYGILHPVYLVYLLCYFVFMIGAIILSVKQKKIGKPKFAGFIAAIVCSNIIVWLFEKFVNWEYEFLSVMYIASELLLLFVYWMIQDYILKAEVPPPIVKEIVKEVEVIKEVEVVKEVEVIKETPTVVVINPTSKDEIINRLLSLLPDGKSLTSKELEILENLVEGKSRKNIAATHHITENTVKTHIAHIYEKFDVTSKDALLALIHTNQS